MNGQPEVLPWLFTVSLDWVEPQDPPYIHEKHQVQIEAITDFRDHVQSAADDWADYRTKYPPIGSGDRRTCWDLEALLADTLLADGEVDFTAVAEQVVGAEQFIAFKQAAWDFVGVLQNAGVEVCRRRSPAGASETAASN